MVFDYRNRIQRYQKLLREQGLRCGFVLKAPNIRYLTGFWGFFTRAEYLEPRRLLCLVILAEGEPLLIVPKVDAAQAEKATAGTGITIKRHVEWQEEGETEDAWGLVLDHLRVNGISSGSIAVEKDFLHLRAYEFILEAFPRFELVNGENAVERMRMIKDSDEIAVMRRCCEVAVGQLGVQLEALKKGGYKEFELALIGRQYLIKQCADAFGDHDVNSPIADGVQLINSGPRLAWPHGGPSTRMIGPTDVVAMDFCDVPSVWGYRIAMGRVVTQRQLTAEEEHIETAIQEAYKTGLALVRPGMSCSQIDSAIRQVLVAAGLAQYILHRNGRGTGIENVELPEIKEGNSERLQAGMVISLEPSIYRPNFASRVENTILVTTDGSEVMTRAPNEMFRISH